MCDPRAVVAALDALTYACATAIKDIKTPCDRRGETGEECEHPDRKGNVPCRAGESDAQAPIHPERRSGRLAQENVCRPTARKMQKVG